MSLDICGKTSTVQILQRMEESSKSEYFTQKCNFRGIIPFVGSTLLLLKVIKVNVLPSNSTHRYEAHKGEHGILYFAQTITDVAISSHNSYISYMNGSENLHLNLRSEWVNLQGSGRICLWGGGVTSEGL